MSDRVLVNRDWLYNPADKKGSEGIGFDDSLWGKVNIPHTNKVFPHNYFDDAEYQFVSWYRKSLSIPAHDAQDHLFLDFDGVMIACEVFVNGEKLAEHKGGYTPFSVELTGHVKPGEDALIAVRVDSTEREDIPPFGGRVDYLTFGGVYRDVSVRLCGPSFIENVFARGADLLANPRLDTDIEIKGYSPGQELICSVKDISGNIVYKTSTSASGAQSSLSMEVPGVTLWSLEKPYLYEIVTELKSSDGLALDSYTTKFGFRDARFCDDGAFRLNGEVVKLIGLNRHQMFPYIGQAAPARLQKRDADILKDELGLNIVRTSHYPQSPHFLDRADEIGLLVLEEIPGWNFIGDDAWKSVSKQELREMIVRDRNHPSIVLWGVRINESGDDHDFYTETNEIAHRLDPSRQTGGIRVIRNSEFLEDVFTFNDFNENVQEANHVPYLITEFGGHMYPTKVWDCEERMIEHALRHAKKQSMQMLDGRIAGAIGWCAFDYNTHNSFGSGDRICHHGVSDIFRLPKWAAHVYASQMSPEKKVVLELASTWTLGDKAGGGMAELVILSNCERLRLYHGGEFMGESYPDVKEYPGLPHPPFIVRGLPYVWGSTWGDLRVEGYVGDLKVADKSWTCDPIPTKLNLWADATELFADGQDMTSLNFQVVDKYDHVVPYSCEIVSFEVNGPAEIIGRNPFPAMGGRGAVYVKSNGEKGTAIVTANAQMLGKFTVELVFA